MIFIIRNANIYKHIESKVDSEINFSLFFIFFQLIVKIWTIRIHSIYHGQSIFIVSLLKIYRKSWTLDHSFVDSEFSRSNAILDSQEGSFDFLLSTV